MYFTTSKIHVELLGGEMPDVIIDEAHDPENEHPFKGNIDLDKLESIIIENRVEKIAYVNVEMNVNMAGGQPGSMENIRKGRGMCHCYNLKVCFYAPKTRG